MEEILHQLIGGLSVYPIIYEVCTSQVVQDAFHQQDVRCAVLLFPVSVSKVCFCWGRNGMLILCLVFSCSGIRIPWCGFFYWAVSPCGIGETPPIIGPWKSRCSQTYPAQWSQHVLLFVRLESVLHARDRLLKPQAGRTWCRGVFWGWRLEVLGHVLFYYLLEYRS